MERYLRRNGFDPLRGVAAGIGGDGMNRASTTSAPQRADFATWDDWMQARSLRLFDQFHARERAERRRKFGWKS
jgi:hypothetical protein